MNKSVINSYRVQPQPTPPNGTIAGRIVPVAAPTSYRRAVVILAALVLPLLAIGVVVYAARSVQPAAVEVPSPGIVERVIAATPVVVERVVEVQASPIVVVVTATPQPAPIAQPVQQPQAAPVAQPARPLPPPPTPARPAAQVASVQAAPPRPVTQAYGCVGLGPCNPPAAPAKVFAGYQCADGRFFAADGPWGMFGFGTWIVEGQGDVVNIRDTIDPNRQTMGWHNNCSKTWR